MGDTADLDRLAKVLEEQYKYYHGWHFLRDRDTILYSQMGGHLDVYCTPDWEGDGIVAIQVVSRDTGEVLEALDIPYREGELRIVPISVNAWDFFRIVRTFLDKYVGVEG